MYLEQPFFLEFFVIDRTGCACVFGFLVDERTGELLSVIARVCVEPSTAIGHFQVGFTAQVPVFRELLVKSFVSSTVEGNIGCGGCSGCIRVIFGRDILIDLEGSIGSIGEKRFQAVAPVFHEWFEGGQRGFDIRGVGGEDVFIEEGGAIGCGFH